MQNMNKFPVQIKPAFAIVAAVAILLFPLKYIQGWVTASVVHELFHLIAIQLMKIRIWGITLDCTGAIIETEPMVPMQELICALLGPLGALLLLITATIAPITAVCALLQSLFNLLPYYPLDGGRVLHNLAEILIGESMAVRVTKCVNIITIIVLSALSVMVQLRYHCGILPLFMVLLLFLRNLKSNYALQTARSNSRI